MLKVIDEIESILKAKDKKGIVGFFRTYVPNIDESYLIEMQDEKHSFSSFGSREIVPTLKVYYIESDVNCDLHEDKRDFYLTCEELINTFFENPTLNETATQFSIKAKYSSTRKDRDYKVCEMLFEIEELL